MENICRITAIVLLLLSVVAGFVGGLQGESFAVFIAMTASGFVSFVSMYALGEILDHVKYLNQNITELRGKIKDSGLAESKKQVSMPKPSYDIRTVGKGPEDKWICKNCGENNEGIAQFCKNCGKYK